MDAASALKPDLSLAVGAYLGALRRTVLSIGYGEYTAPDSAAIGADESDQTAVIHDDVRRRAQKIALHKSRARDTVLFFCKDHRAEVDSPELIASPGTCPAAVLLTLTAVRHCAHTFAG